MRSRATIARAGLAAAVAAAIAAAASCWHPSLDPSASASELTVARLGEPVMTATLEFSSWYDADRLRFVPESAAAPTRGLLTASSGTQFAIVGVTADAESGVAYAGGFYQRYAPFGDATLVVAAPDGSPEALVIAGPSEAALVDMASAEDISSPALPAAGRLGVGAVAAAGSATLACLALPEDGSAEPPSWSAASWGSGSVDLAATTALEFDDEALVDEPGIFVAVGGYLYLSCSMIDGAGRIYRWPETGGAPTAFAETYGPLVGALSDGRLLAESGDVVTVLDADAEALFSFPAGTLRFAGERYDAASGEMVAVLTRCAYLRRYGFDGDTRKIRIEVYELPSAELATLAR
ncbi:MAG: hypothetical protein H7A27_01460 [Spirochaetaceae bacterium]|nr:hypothetical protein [Spirochaetaceae bacterium]